ncbi:hypothetical protein JXA34_00320 [Patescibacteria group bacterium]|nr:hypothetical protein [Patescibacteria group bacterium]
MSERMMRPEFNTVQASGEKERIWTAHSQDKETYQTRRKMTESLMVAYRASRSEQIDRWATNVQSISGEEISSWRMRDTVMPEFLKPIEGALSEQVKEIVPDTLREQPKVGLDIEPVDAILVAALEVQSRAPELIADMDTILEQATTDSEWIPDTVQKVRELSAKLRKAWAYGKPEDTWTRDHAELYHLSHESPERIAQAQEAKVRWEGVQQNVATRLAGLEAMDVDIWYATRDFESAVHAAENGNWEKLVIELDSALSAVERQEYEAHSEGISEALENVGQSYGPVFMEGVRGLEDLDGVSWAPWDYGDIYAGYRNETGLCVSLADDRRNRDMRDRFEDTFFPGSWIRSSEAAVDLDELPSIMQPAFGNFENGRVIVWHTSEVDGLVLAACCSVDGDYKADVSRAPRLPNSGVWFASSEDVYYTLKERFDSEGNQATDPEYERKLRDFMQAWSERIAQYGPPQPEEITDRFLQVHKKPQQRSGRYSGGGSKQRRTVPVAPSRTSHTPTYPTSAADEPFDTGVGGETLRAAFAEAGLTPAEEKVPDVVETIASVVETTPETEVSATEKERTKLQGLISDTERKIDDRMSELQRALEQERTEAIDVTSGETETSLVEQGTRFVAEFSGVDSDTGETYADVINWDAEVIYRFTMHNEINGPQYVEVINGTFGDTFEDEQLGVPGKVYSVKVVNPLEGDEVIETQRNKKDKFERRLGALVE